MELGVEAGFDVGMPAQQVPGPRERVGRGFVAGEEECHRFVAGLLVAHAAAPFLVLGEEQHGEEIAPVFRGAAPGLDQPIDRGIEPSPGLAKAPGGWQRDMLEQRGERQRREALEELHAGRDRPADLLCFFLYLGAEERLAHDTEGESHHLLMDVDDKGRRCPGQLGPAFRGALRVLHHSAGIERDPLLVEGGLDQPALPPMKLAFASEQPFAQEILGQLETPALVKSAVLRDQQVLDQIGMVEEVNPAVSQADQGDVTVVAGHPLEQAERVAAESEQELTGEASGGTGDSGFRHLLKAEMRVELGQRLALVRKRAETRTAPPVAACLRSASSAKSLSTSSVPPSANS